MAKYYVVLASSAEKELKKLPGQLIARLIPRLENLASNPRPSGCKKLRGGEGEWHSSRRLPRGVYHRRREITGGSDANPSPKRDIRTMSAVRAFVPGVRGDLNRVLALGKRLIMEIASAA